MTRAGPGGQEAFRPGWSALQRHGNHGAAGVSLDDENSGMTGRTVAPTESPRQSWTQMTLRCLPCCNSISG